MSREDERTSVSAAGTADADSGVIIPPQLESIDCEEDSGVYLDADELQQAQQHIKQWMNLEEEITKLNAAIRARRKQRKELDVQILKFMTDNQIPHFDLSKGKLSRAVSKRKQSFTHAWVMSKLQSMIPSDMHETVNAELKNRPVTEVPRLKHNKPRRKAGAAATEAAEGVA